MKRKPLARKSRLKRGGRVKPINPKRRKSEFARTYHSKARVAWMQGLRCACGCGVRPCEVAHVGNGGMSRKAGYERTVPLAPFCHRKQHEGGWESIGLHYDTALMLANRYQAGWERYAEGE